ncbi:MAG: hypothetical protein ACOH2N_14895, partial [Devosia sp.]
MRYMLHLFSIALAFLFAPVAAIISAFAYRPTAHETLALDRIAAPVAVIPVQRSRFRAFVDSARSHVDFTAGHFDPG